MLVRGDPGPGSRSERIKAGKFDDRIRISWAVLHWIMGGQIATEWKVGMLRNVRQEKERFTK